MSLPASATYGASILGTSGNGSTAIFAIKVIKETDARMNKNPVIVHGPIVYYADATAEKRYQPLGCGTQECAWHEQRCWQQQKIALPHR